MQKTPTSFTIFDYAYDNMGNHIVAGATAVPEPSSAILLGFGMLSMGAAGVRELRRRKRTASEQASEPVTSA